MNWSVAVPRENGSQKSTALVPSERFAELIRDSTDTLTKIRDDVERATIASQTDVDRLIDTAKGCKVLVKKIEAAVDQHYGEAKKLIQTINAITKKWRDLADAIERTCKDKIRAWQRAEELRIAEEKRRQEEALAALNRRIEEEAKTKGLEVPPAPVVVPPVEPPRTLTTETGAKATKIQTWRAIYAEADKVALIAAAAQDPRWARFLMIDEKAVNAAVRSEGLREIPGIPVRLVDDVRIG